MPPPSESGVERREEAWYHADFCHAYTWVYDAGDKLRVRWGEREAGVNLHRNMECQRCEDLVRHKVKPRHGEFFMDKPAADFSSTESLFAVLAELTKWVPGLTDDAPAPQTPAVSGEEGQ